jgi:hypothetical protein
MNRKEAIEQGLKRYDGKPCVQCGETEKYVTGYSCVSCAAKASKNRDPEIYKRYIKSDKGQEWLNEYRKTDVYRDVQNKWKKTDYEKYKDKYIGYNLKKYGITREEYDAMYEAQNGQCYVCKDSSDRRLSVDHNHETGENRKLLCTKCNTALGLLKEDVNIMNNLIEYVKEHND